MKKFQSNMLSQKKNIVGYCPAIALKPKTDYGDVRHKFLVG